MIKRISSSFFLAVALATIALSGPAAAVTPAQMKACKAMGASLQVRQNELEEKTAARDALGREVELAGLAWDDVEIHRRASAAHAKAADTAKAAYEARKGDLMRVDMGLQSEAAMLNASVASYNEMCVKT